MIPTVRTAIPPGLLTAARYGYFGHRFELAAIGFHEQLAIQDLVRAYPWATTQLPCFAHGTWIQPVWTESWDLEFRTDSRPAVVLVSWSVPLNRTHPWGPFPWRYPDGGTAYPRRGVGWVWSPELEAARAIWPARCFKVHDAWQFLPSCSHRPWDWLGDLIQVWDHPSLKRTATAIPGKLAQSRPTPGRWFDPIAAGYVTSVVRGRMLTELMAAGRHAVACVADALWTTRPVKTETGEGPGSWRVSQHAAVLCVQPGLSFEGDQVLAAQGTPAQALAGYADRLLECWNDFGLKAKHPDGSPIGVDVAFDHFIGVKEGLETGAEIGEWVRAHHTVRFHPLRKRETWEAKPVPAGPSFHMLTQAPEFPDPDLFYQGPGPDPERIGGIPMSSPYWLEDGRCLAGEPETWPTDADEVLPCG